ncbi:unnamed protein product, partial [Mesorhabditis spiculigera]
MAASQTWFLAFCVFTCSYSSQKDVDFAGQSYLRQAMTIGVSSSDQNLNTSAIAAVSLPLDSTAIAAAVVSLCQNQQQASSTTAVFTTSSSPKQSESTRPKLERVHRVRLNTCAYNLSKYHFHIRANEHSTICSLDINRSGKLHSPYDFLSYHQQLNRAIYGEYGINHEPYHFDPTDTLQGFIYCRSF